MMTDTMALFAMFGALTELTGRNRSEAVVPEPEFKRFHLPKRSGTTARAAALAPVNTTRDRRTLEELGVPGPLARELEASLEALGMTKGERITGFTFRTPDGASHALRATPARAPAAGGDLAA